MNLALTTALIGETPERHAVINPTYAMHPRSYSRTIGPQSFPAISGDNFENTLHNVRYHTDQIASKAQYQCRGQSMIPPLPRRLFRTRD